MGNAFITFGLLLIVVGIVLNVIGRLHLPMLPGDIFIQKGNFTFYFPIVTSIIVSIILTVIVNLFK